MHFLSGFLSAVNSETVNDLESLWPFLKSFDSNFKSFELNDLFVSLSENGAIIGCFNFSCMLSVELWWSDSDSTNFLSSEQAGSESESCLGSSSLSEVEYRTRVFADW